MTAPEFSRPVRLDTLGEAERAMTLAAEDGERAALARRFGLIGIDRLEAEVRLRRSAAAIEAQGRLTAAVTQACVATAEPVPATVDERFTLRFVPAGSTTEEEIELSEADCDVIEYDGGAIDLGEAVAETLALALDPFPRSRDADATLREAGVLSEEEAREAASPFAGLKGLVKE